MQRVRSGALGLLLCAAAAAQATAAEPRRRFEIPAAPRPEALIQFALQADVTLVGPSVCHGRAPPVSGDLPLKEALRTLLVGSDCAFAFVEPGVVRIFLAPSKQAPSPAPTPAPEPPVVVSELVVTTQKAAANIDKVAGSVSLVRESQIRAMGAADAQDLAPVLAGMATTNLGPGRDKVMLRGLSDGVFTGRTQSTVGIFLGDVPLTRNAPNPDLRLTDIQRVEVARGPQGALYGAGALAGVYRMVTNPPELETLSGEVSLAGSFTKGGSPSRSADMMLNVPLIHDRLAVRVVGYDEWRGGYIRDGGPKSPAVDRTLRSGGRAGVRFQIDPDWRLDVSAASQTLATADTHYAIPSAGRFRRPRQLAEAHHNTFHEAALTLDGSGDWGSLTSTTGIVSHRYSSDFDASSVASGRAAPPPAESLFTEEARTRLFTQDVTLRAAGRSRLRWLAGAYFADVGERSSSSLQDQRRTGQLAPVFDKDRVDQTLEGALYGNVTYDLGAGWTTSVGVRAFQNRLDHQSSIRGRTGVGSRRLAMSFGGLSPTASLSYALGPRTTVYALYSEGYRPGGVNAIGRDWRHRAPVTFSPDRLENYEIGMHFRTFDQRLWGRVSGFRQSWRRVASDQYSWAGSPFTANVGNIRNLGVGVEGGYDVSAALSAQLQFQASSANLVHWDSRFVTQPAHGLPGVPEVSGGGLVEYRRPLTGDLSLLLVGQASYVGPSHVTFDASSQTMGGYFADRLSADVTATRWSAGVFVDNIADEAGDTFAFGNPFSFGRTQQVTPQRPRTVGLRFTARL